MESQTTNLVRGSERVPASESPRNGVHGLRHWKSDLMAGLIVSLVSVPLSLGIAVASGAPPITGLISSIIAGLIFPFLGGAYVTISGPAAGLAPVVYASILALGHGQMDSGYKLVLAVICIAGLLQVILSYLKAARLSSMFPASAVEGMLASIGLLIIAKQVPNFIGHPFKAHEFFGLVTEAPSEILRLDPKVFAVSIVCLGVLFGWALLKRTRLRFIPPQLVAVVVGVVMGHCLQVDPKFMIHIPDNIFHGFTFPNFQGLFENQGLWVTALGCAITLTLVDGCESLATIKVAKIGPEQLLIFGSTVLVTLSSDLLWGLIFGTALKFLITVFYSIRNAIELHHNVSLASLSREIVRMFKNPVSSHATMGDVHVVRFDGPVVCFNLSRVNHELSAVPTNCPKVQLYFTPEVGIIDHTSATMLMTFKADLERCGREVDLIGLEKMSMSSPTSSCMRHTVPAK